MEAEEELQPLTMPQVREVKFADDGSFEFVAELEVRPNYELPDLADGRAARRSRSRSPTTRSTPSSRQLREQQAVWEPVEDEDSGRWHARRGGSARVRWKTPTRIPMKRTMPVLSSAPTGCRPRSTRRSREPRPATRRLRPRSFPTTMRTTNAPARRSTTRSRSRRSRRKVLPEIDDELAKTLGLEDLAELKERLREALERRKLAERRDEWRRSLLDQLSEEIDLNSLPSSLVQNAVSERINRFAYEMAMRGAGPEGRRFRLAGTLGQGRAGARAATSPTI